MQVLPKDLQHVVVIQGWIKEFIKEQPTGDRYQLTQGISNILIH